MTPGPSGIAPLTSGGRPPKYDQYGQTVDPGCLSGIGILIIMLASRYGPEGQDLAMNKLKNFFSIRRRAGKPWS